MTIKICTKCKLQKEANKSYFEPAKAYKNGLRSWCRVCVKEYKESNKEQHNNSQKRWKSNNLDYKNPNVNYNREYYQKNKKYYSDYKMNKMKCDPSFRAIFNARERARAFLNKNIKFSKSLGCSFEYFKSHLERQFQPGMSWDNYGDWHIDHKYPLSIAYKEGRESFAKACLYTNLQPLWAVDNIKKGNRI